MSKFLKEEPQANGTTLLTLDLNGVQVINLVVPTVIRHEMSDEVLDLLALRVAEKSRLTRADVETVAEPA